MNTKSFAAWMLTLAVVLGTSAVAMAEEKTALPQADGAAQPTEVVLDLGNKVSLKLVEIPAGKFLMGSPKDEAGHQDTERRVEVEISRPFYMGVYEVTTEQYAQFQRDSGRKDKVVQSTQSVRNSRRKDRGVKRDEVTGDHPVEFVEWDDAQAFCEWLSKKTGKKVALPTEAQWEYACRAGTTGPYAGTGILNEMGWYAGNSDGKTYPMGQKKPNAWSAPHSASLAVCLCGFATALDDKDKKEEPKTVAEKFKALKTEFREAESALEKEFIAAKTAEEKNAISDKFFALRPKFAEKAVAIAATDPKDPGAFEAATVALRLGAEGATAEKAATIVGEHHASNPKLKSMFQQLGQNAGGQKLLKTLHEKATDKDVKGATLYFLAAGMLEEADYPRGGPPMPAEKQAAAFKEAETLLNKAAKEYGDVEITSRGDTKSITKAVESQLFFLNNLTLGKVLPDAASEDLDGKKVKISDYRGNVVVLDIWATWCGPCRAMIPHERELVERLKDKPFVFISVSADAEKDTLVKFLEKEPMPWTHWWAGPKGAPIVDYRVHFYPTIYVLDEKGVIRYKHVREKSMDEAVEKLLKEIKPKS